MPVHINVTWAAHGKGGCFVYGITPHRHDVHISKCQTRWYFHSRIYEKTN